MKRITSIRVRNASISLGLALAAITLGPPIAGAAYANSASSIRVVGSGVRAPSSSTDVPFTFSFDAGTIPSSTGIYGTLSGSYPHDPYFRHGHSAPGKFATFSGVVTCLRVSGTTATIGAVLTSGYGYDGTYSGKQRDLTGDWFITTVRDPKHGTDTMGYIDWGDRAYFANPAHFGGHAFRSFDALCNNPSSDLGNAQFKLASGDIRVGR